MSAAAAFAFGARTAVTSVLCYVLFGTFVGYGALCHDLGFSLPWALVSTALVWAGPAQVIVVSTLGSGLSPTEAAVAVGLSGVRLLPMIRTPQTRFHQLLLPAHFTAASMWVEGLRVAPGLPRERRVACCNGIGTTMMAVALMATIAGFEMAARLPALFAAVVLFLTPMSFLVSIARGARELLDKLALALGLLLTPVFLYFKVELGLLAAGLIAGTLAYVAQRVRSGR